MRYKNIATDEIIPGGELGAHFPHISFAPVPDADMLGFLGLEQLPDLPPPEPAKPTQCTRRQGRLALLSVGKLANVDTLIAAIPDDTQRTAAQIEYEADAWDRSNTTLQSMWAGLGGTESELDGLFALAVTL